MEMHKEGHSLKHIKYTGGQDHNPDHVVLVVSKWNPGVTHALRDGAFNTLIEAGVRKENIQICEVPGTFELPAGAQFAIEESEPTPDAVICIGCVIQGETRHFEFICHAAADGIMKTGLKYHLPVIFGVLTPDTQEQAEARAGGALGNKGEEAAVAALEMIDLKRSLQ